MAGKSKQLSCAVCGQVMATAVWRTFKGLEITTPDGFLVAPGSTRFCAMPATGATTSAARRAITR